MSAPWGRPWMLRDGGGLRRGHAAPNPNHMDGMVGVQYMWCILYCTPVAIPNEGARRRMGGGSEHRRFGGPANGSSLKRQKATRRTEKPGTFY